MTKKRTKKKENSQRGEQTKSTRRKARVSSAKQWRVYKKLLNQKADHVNEIVSWKNGRLLRGKTSRTVRNCYLCSRLAVFERAEPLRFVRYSRGPSNLLFFFSGLANSVRAANHLLRLRYKPMARAMWRGTHSITANSTLACHSATINNTFSPTFYRYSDCNNCYPTANKSSKINTPTEFAHNKRKTTNRTVIF